MVKAEVFIDSSNSCSQGSQRLCMAMHGHVELFKVNNSSKLELT